jgi:hypothetical protein
MSESQGQVLALIETVAKRRGEPVHDFMASRHGSYWRDRYYNAQPDQPVAWDSTEKSRPGVIETTGFALLREKAKELLARDASLSEPMAIAKAAEMYPDLVANHEVEMRRNIAG